MPQQIFLDMPEKKVVEDLSGGVDYSKPASKVGDNTLADAVNVQFFRNLLRVDSGYKQYRQAVNGIPQSAFQFSSNSGVVQTLLLTTQTLYVDSGQEWQYASDGVVNTTLAQQVNSGSAAFVLSQLAPLLNVGDRIGIFLANGNQLRTTVLTIGGLNLVTVDAVPVGTSALAGAAVVRAPKFNGSINFQPVEVQWPTLNSLIFTNGVDPIQIWDGVQCKVLPGWTGITARVLVAFHGFLIAFDTTEGGMRFPQRKRYSDQGNPENTTTGLSGFIDLTDTEDFILAALQLGPWLIIYRASSVMRSSYVGDPIFLFFDEYMLQNVGVWSQNSVAETGSTHVFVGPTGIFRYSGGYDIEDVGDQLFDQLYGPQGITNNKAGFLTTMFYVEDLDEVWLFVPTGQNVSSCDTLYRLDQGRNAWWPRKMANFTIGFGFIETISNPGRTWQQATIPWNQDTTTWFSSSKSIAAPLILLLDPVQQVSWLYDFASSSDGGAPINWSVTTKDFEVEKFFIRTDGFYAKGTGNGVLVEWSFDRGKSFIPIGTLNFGLTFTKQQVNAQYVGEVVRARLSGSDPTSSLDWLRLDIFPESEW